MVSEEVKWIEKEKEVYNVDTDEMEYVKYLRMGFIDKYNSTMGDVDLSDQLRGSYHPDRWVRNRKWCWSMFFWGFGVLLTNAYVMYCKIRTLITSQRNQCRKLLHVVVFIGGLGMKHANK